MKKKFLAAILAAAVMVTSIQFPAVEVRAEGTDFSDYDTVFQNEGLYKMADDGVAGLWEAFETAYKDAKERDEVTEGLKTAKSALDQNANKRDVCKCEANGGAYQTPDVDTQNAKDIYKENDRFQFPDLGETKVLEMEYLLLDNAGVGGWNVQITEVPSLSNGMYLNALNNGDKAYLYYEAPKTGVYSAVLTYICGDTLNAFDWTEESEKINSVTVNNLQNSTEAVPAEVTFTFEVEAAGEGKVIVVPGSRNAPGFDKMIITAEALDLNVNKSIVGVSALSNGTIEGADKVRQNSEQKFIIRPNQGYEVKSVTVNGEKVDLNNTNAVNVTEVASDGRGAVLEVTVPSVEADANGEFTIEAEFDYFNYSEDNRFAFPTEKEQPVTLEMEYLVLINDEEGDEDRNDSTIKYPLSVGEDNDWNGQTAKFLNSLNNNDEALLYYNAPKMGTYKAVVTYRSGNPQNGLTWSETTDSKIQTGTINAGANDHPAVHTYEFEFIVDKAGDGVLKFAGSGANAPQMDKIEITPKAFTYNVTKVPGENGSIEGEATTITEGNEVTYTITPDEGYVVKNVTVDGATSVENNTNDVYTVTISNPTKDVTIGVEFEKEAYVAGYNAVLEDNILMKFHMKLSQTVIEQNPKVVIDLGGSERKEFAYSAGTLEGDYYVFEYGVPAKDMNTNINVKVVSADGGKTFFTGVYTVAGYTADLMNKNTENTVMQNLVDAMLEFGDYASKYFEKESTVESPALTADDLEFLQTMERQVSGQSGSYVGSSLLLRSETIVRHYFNSPVHLENLPEGYTSGNKEGTNGTTFYYIESGIPAHELGKVSPITITTDNGEMSITFNPLSYAYSVINQDSTDEEMIRLEKVVSAMYLYYKAADAYLDSNSNTETD